MNISDKIQALRLLMQEAGWDAAVISGTDPHGSEYLPERWQQRKWISGFTGSFGTVVITLTHAGLWTDTRYFIQSRRELEGTEFELHPLRVPNAVNYPEWLAANLTPGAVVGFDGECVTYREAEHLKQALKALNATIDNRPSFLDAIWNDRPELPLNSVFILEKKYSGKDTREKLERLRRQIEEQSCTHMLLSSLDQIAWLFNIRCHDIPYNPVAISYALVDEKNATLFITPGKISDNVNKILHAQGVSVMPYDSIPGVLQSLPAQTKIMADGDTLNYSAFQNLLINCTVYDVQSPVILDKAIKNSVETEGFRKAFLYDGLAMERFFFWLERTLENDVPLTEIDAGKKLSWMRTLSQDAMGDSFGYISAYGANAALPHYNAVVGACSRLEKKGLYLIDSGSHYLYGTTGPLVITRKGRLHDCPQGNDRLKQSCLFKRDYRDTSGHVGKRSAMEAPQELRTRNGTRHRTLPLRTRRTAGYQDELERSGDTSGNGHFQRAGHIPGRFTWCAS